MSYVFTPPSFPSLPVSGTDDRFPVRRIFCIGRNYADHAREMGKDPDRDPPFFFLKPAFTIVESGVPVAYPPLTKNFHYEAELVVAIGAEAESVSEADSLAHVWGYAVGNDLTRRDLQLEARDKGRPWDEGKGFDNSAIIGPIHPVAAVGHPERGKIRLSVNGTVRQDADIADLIWSVPEIISILSRSMTLLPGDIVMTGTPAGVGPLVPGDVCTVTIEGLGDITTPIAERAAK